MSVTTPRRYSEKAEIEIVVNAMLEPLTWPYDEEAQKRYKSMDSEQKLMVHALVRLRYREWLLDDIAFTPPPPGTLQHKLMELAL